MNPPPRRLLEHDVRRRRNGDVGDTLHDLGLGPAEAPDPRPGLFPSYARATAVGVLMLTIATVFALGVWKLVELVARAL